MTWRRLRVLVDHLPPESMTKAAIRDELSLEEWESLPAAEGWGPWSHEAQLLAAVVDRVALVEWAVVAVNSEKGKAPKAPQPMPRPGIGAPPRAEAERHRSDTIRKIAILKAREANHGGQPTPEQVEAAMTELGG